MTRLVLVTPDRTKQSEQKASQPLNEGEAAKALLESNGYPAKSGTTGSQWQTCCPFHEDGGQITARAGNGKFYIDKKTSKYYCMSASCGEKGNLQTLEKFFGLESDPTAYKAFISLDTVLRGYEMQLPKGERREVFYDKGLNDATIDRFRYGYDQEKGRYVIPYLEGRRPVALRFYNPGATKENGLPKYYWKEGSEATLFNPGDGGGDRDNAVVFITEGESKAALLCQMGFNAVGLPGASMWKSEWSQAFNHAKKIYILMDNDNPDHPHNRRENCRRCDGECEGHNPGQVAAMRLLDIFGHRAENVLLPFSADENGDLYRKTDINEYFMRDGRTIEDFGRLVSGENALASPYKVKSLKDIRESPPDEAVFLVANGLLPRSGRLLVSGAPKVGKSIFIENLVLSIAAGIPFLGKFPIANTNPTPGHRVLLLDRELSERSLFDRLNILMEHRLGYSAADEKLLIDHRIELLLDQPGAGERLVQVIQTNQAEVVVLDTAYKFFAGDVESSTNVKKAFSALDYAIKETGVSVILTHHHRKSGSGGKTEAPHADSVVGTFLWTGWPNGTVLLNFLSRKVQSPFETTASFVAFRDAAPPEPLKLMRGRESIAYTSIEEHSFDEDDPNNSWDSAPESKPRLNYDEMGNFLLSVSPLLEEEVVYQAMNRFGCSQGMAKLVLLDVLDRNPDYYRDGKGTRESPYVVKYRYDREEEKYEATFEQGELMELEA